jgi:Ca-activated chloride channel family protein
MHVPRALAIPLLLVVAPGLGAQAPPPDATTQPTGPVFRSGIDLVALNVTVTDPQDRYILGLSADDFRVYEDGVQQDLSFFAAGRVPLDLALLVDTSASMAPRLPIVQEAAAGFAHSLGPGDRALLVAFDDVARVVQPWTSDRSAVLARIRETRAKGATALYTALYVTLKEFARETRALTEVRRQAIVVLTDGEDTASLVSFDDVLDLARRQGVSIYTIALGSSYAPQPVASRYFSQARYALLTLARETGGQSFAPPRAEELAATYGHIATDLAHQYTLGYTSKNPRQDGAYRRIVVRVASRPDARLRARAGD